MTIRRTSHARYDTWYHLVWVTKYRKRIWTHIYGKDKVASILKEIATQYDMTIDRISCLSDHVHMSISAPPRIAPSRMAQILKSVSTKLLFQEFPWLRNHYWGGEIWAQGYFVRTIGPGLTKEQIDKYVMEQSE
jgi:putative transposase